MALSVVVLGELFYGALKSMHANEELRRIEDFMFNCEVLDCDSHTSRIYAQIKQDLGKKGKPLPENDVWIAAQALQHDLVLVTLDKHFKLIDGLKLESW